MPKGSCGRASSSAQPLRARCDYCATCLIAAALFIQLRLLCNLFDGMVAIEGGLASKDGPFWNEFPDRVADILILVGAGLACGFVALGWAAACMAVLTAYVRELGRAVNVPADYRGPMAKQAGTARHCRSPCLSSRWAPPSPAFAAPPCW